MSNPAAPACPLAGAIGRARQAAAAEFPTIGIAPTALALRLRSRAIGPIDLPLAGRSDGPLAPDLRGRCGRAGVARTCINPSTCYAFCFLPNLTCVKFGSACLPLGRRYRARPPGRRCRIYDRRECPNRPCPSLALSGNRTDRPATGRSLRRSSGSRFSGVVRAFRGDRQ